MNTETGCLVCGRPIVYSTQSATYACSLCGGSFEANAVCEEGHYVCDKCHSSARTGETAPGVFVGQGNKEDAPLQPVPGEEGFLGLIRATDERDPGRIFRRVVSLESVHMHGPEHHSIVPCVMLAAYRNNGGDIDFEAAIGEAAERGGKVPGGICGFWGACGAAIGAGIFASVMIGSTPYNDEAWGAPQQLTARCLEKIAAVGGPRCCKRTSRIAIEACTLFAKERYGVEIPLEDFRCIHHTVNKECIHERCPYY